MWRNLFFKTDNPDGVTNMKISEAAQEKEIQALAPVAPRLTPSDIDAVIMGEDYHQFPGTPLTV